MSLSKSQGLPRTIVAGLAGDGGKTLVTLGLVKALASQDLRVAAFKKGPDFIDAAWLGKASPGWGRNLDTFMMPRDAVLRSLASAVGRSDVAIIEGNRGLYDGLDCQGSHSTAELAKLTRSPVVLVVDTTKMTRTVAALVKGCVELDPDVSVAGVILNRVGTSRQEHLIRRAVEQEIGIKVVGVIPRLCDQHLPSRHLGLVTAQEHSQAEEILERLSDIVKEHVDLKGFLKLAETASELPLETAGESMCRAKTLTRIGVLQDEAFTFYYPENLEALEEAGAELLPISPLHDEKLPEIDALYAGGGFPEVYAEKLSRNLTFRKALAMRIEAGLPVWAECGGLIYLARELAQGDSHYPMVGALPIWVEQMRRPQGHGYVKAEVDSENLFLEKGTSFCGHEFHYSRLESIGDEVKTVLSLRRGVGIGRGRDGVHSEGVVASYTHLHALGVPKWAPALVMAASGGRR